MPKKGAKTCPFLAVMAVCKLYVYYCILQPNFCVRIIKISDHIYEVSTIKAQDVFEQSKFHSKFLQNADACQFIYTNKHMHTMTSKTFLVTVHMPLFTMQLCVYKHLIFTRKFGTLLTTASTLLSPQLLFYVL